MKTLRLVSGRKSLHTQAMCLGLLLIATIAIAQEPVFKSGVSIVEVPIVAKDSSDRAIGDLQKSDVRVFDNGVEQSILSFERMGGMVRSTGEPTARLSVILFDTLNSSWTTQINGRRAALQALERMQKGPDKIAIFAMGDKLHLLHDFSRDFVSLRQAIEKYPGERPQLGVDQGSARFDAEHPPPPQAPGNGPMGKLAPRAPSANNAESVREQRTVLTMDVFRALAKILKEAPGEKSLLWITSGFRPPERVHEDIRRTMQTLADAKILLYPIDARGVVSAQAFDQAMALGELAEQTGGRVYMNNNDTASFIRDAIEDSREGYVLTYTPSNVKEASTHVIKLETSRKGISLRYRPGYLSAQ
jgi:VWFA-related protein